MIQIFNLYKVYPNNHPALTDISLHIKKGDFVFVTGPSGAGKTTLIKLIFCAEKATRGQIIVNGINLAKIKKSGISYLRRSIGVVFQDFKLLNNRTAYENVVFALEVTGARRKEIKRKAWQVLKLVGLQNRLDATPLGLRLCDGSPCLPGNHPDGYDCGLIGAWGEGCSCGPNRRQPTTWGSIKSTYR